MNISIILVNYNGCAVTANALRSILAHSPHSQIIVVDNNSSDGSREALPTEFPNITFVPLKENRGFGAANNAGAAVAQGEYLFFLNNDTMLVEDTPFKLATLLASHNEIGACGPKLLNEDRTFQLSFGDDPSIVHEWKTRRLQRKVQQRHRKTIQEFDQAYGDEQNVDWVTGAALMISRELFQSIGGFDEFFFMYFEDSDLCRRVRLCGYQVFYVPGTKLVHYGGKSYHDGNEKIALEYRRSQLQFYKKHRSRFQQLMLRIYLAFKSHLQKH